MELPVVERLREEAEVRDRHLGVRRRAHTSSYGTFDVSGTC